MRRPAERAASVSPGLEAGWLTFVAGSRKRRLASYPESWWSLPDPELERLCVDARPSTPLARVASPESAAPRIAPRPAPAIRAEGPLAAAAIPRVTGSPLAPPLNDEIRSLARECRAAGLAAVAAMLRLKRLLGDRDIEPGTAEHKAARRTFVETFYFGGAS